GWRGIFVGASAPAPMARPTARVTMASLGRASVIMASGTTTSRILGFVKAIVLAQAIGVVGSVSADAYATATIVPNSIYAIIAQGVLNAVLVPQIVRASSAPDGGRAYINKLVTIAVLIFGGIALTATVASPLLMRFYGVGEAIGRASCR